MAYVLKRKKLLLSMTLVLSLLAGCMSSNGNEPNTAVKPKDGEASPVVEANLEKDPYEGVEDTSDMPDWKGKQIKLKFWYAGGNGTGAKVIPTQDVVLPELLRATGVTMDRENSFDNGGQDSYEIKMTKIVATNSYPDVVEGLSRSGFEQLVEKDLLYDLTDLIPKYMPNYWKFINNPAFQLDLKGSKREGKLYSIQVAGWSFINTKLMKKEDFANPLEYKQATGGDVPGRGFVFVRDDILKKIYPQAKSYDELGALMEQKNGNLSKQEYLDVPIKSMADFIQFLREIKKLNLKENGKDVVPFWTHNGSDSWLIGTILSGTLNGYNTHVQMDNNYFTYWDKERQTVDYMFKQPWYKDIMKQWNELVREQIAEPEAIIQTDTQFNEKKDTGQYAMTWGWIEPDRAKLAKAGKTYKYRKVYLDVPPDEKKFVQPYNATGLSPVSFFKNRIKAEDLPQILRFYDIAYTKAGQNLAYYGPRSAGLFKEENGKRTFIDKDIADATSGARPNTVYKDKYGLRNEVWPQYPFTLATDKRTKEAVDIKVTRENWDQHYWYGNVEGLNQVPTEGWFIDNFSDVIPEVKKFWSARAGFENAMKKVYTAQSDEQFEKLYTDMVDYAEQNGLTDETLVKINQVFAERNKEQMANLK
ncbi:hypothetical protein SY83_01580 [Paenibacillus swuensis]|uniref:ABC transporter substrate-binding protein n=1 Tax=Paenibacillus swuensis TaxID=1178515 RepID=A0A172TE96_9BACL|nr:hypothetical protein [Paenibacillus swuensis]ANE45234.1 hypothetical protein SY83_01580 [Paenibacillus swuensis]